MIHDLIFWKIIYNIMHFNYPRPPTSFILLTAFTALLAEHILTYSPGCMVIVQYHFSCFDRNNNLIMKLKKKSEESQIKYFLL